MKKVLLGMSGGVDSTVAAHLLQKQGYDVTGAYMKLWSDTEDSEREQRNIDKVQKIAKFLNIPLQILDLKEEFYQEVVQKFIYSYQHGYTPNPCIICNQKFKFGLMEKTAKGNFDYISSGHYARVIEKDNEFQLLQASYLDKDQSYVLYHISQEQLARCLFPLGEYGKTQVRFIANNLGLDTQSLSDSQDICFIAKDKSYRDLLKQYSAIGPPGEFVDQEGNVLGKHLGIGNYTIGQRKNLGIAFGKKMFVSKIDPSSNQITVTEAANMMRDQYSVKNVSWNTKCTPNFPVSVEVANRYQAKRVPAFVHVKTNTQGKEVKVHCREPQRAITPGQAAVFYRGNRCLGGGIISD